MDSYTLLHTRGEEGKAGSESKLELGGTRDRIGVCGASPAAGRRVCF
jgi:hypothetical protein